MLTGILGVVAGYIIGYGVCCCVRNLDHDLEIAQKDFEIDEAIAKCEQLMCDLDFMDTALRGRAAAKQMQRS